MQNEITELRNQVRTLKRIVCCVCCLFGVFVFIGCSGRGANMNRGSTHTSDNSDGGALIPVAVGLILEILGGEDEEETQQNIPNIPPNGVPIQLVNPQPSRPTYPHLPPQPPLPKLPLDNKAEKE